MPQPQFTIPIAPCEGHTGGSIACTQPHPQVYVLTWTSPPENRLTVPFLEALLTALDVIEFGDYKPGVVITTSGLPKFYSNGASLEHALTVDGFWPLLYKTFARFLSFPMPTLALIQGHAFAGGIFLAMAHDYRLGPGSKGWICVNELQFHAPLPRPVASMLKMQLPTLHFRDIALEARKFTGEQAAKLSLVDGVAHSFTDALRFINDRDLLEKAQSRSYGHIKTEMYADLLEELTPEAAERAVQRITAEYEHAESRRDDGRKWYEKWVAQQRAKSKI
ncbi:hypothetical protein QQS21_000064 [Conoideocrella luteorostrata]|uniref:Enoyl-CoA hydratase/isomerase n=1 Tax=Conoideocrella luteorostrata TaxID=1105319 RepID=A0AAJ0D098_9HYPO|nr:hypothetical protein QQS21_000064 [Conoideocrella luteorostrata]